MHGTMSARTTRAYFGCLATLFMVCATSTAWSQISVPATSSTGVFTLTWSHPALPWEGYQYVVS